MGLDIFAGTVRTIVYRCINCGSRCEDCNPDDYQLLDDGPHWRASYGAFGALRTALALYEGIDLHDMEGYGGERLWTSVDSALTPLLHHSDCDGVLEPADCRTVADRMSAVIASGVLRSEYADWYDERARALRDLLKECADAGWTAVFS